MPADIRVSSRLKSQSSKSERSKTPAISIRSVVDSAEDLYISPQIT